jgi:hypothetical protein
VQFLAAHFWYKILGAILFGHCARAIRVQCWLRHSMYSTGNSKWCL